jgi:hypothetical protein
MHHTSIIDIIAKDRRDHSWTREVSLYHTTCCNISESTSSEYCIQTGQALRISQTYTCFRGCRSLLLDSPRFTWIMKSRKESLAERPQSLKNLGSPRHLQLLCPQTESPTFVYRSQSFSSNCIFDITSDPSPTQKSRLESHHAKSNSQSSRVYLSKPSPACIVQDLPRRRNLDHSIWP